VICADVAAGDRIQQGQNVIFSNSDVISLSQHKQERPDFPGVDAAGSPNRRFLMRYKLHLSALIAISLMTATSAAFAQNAGAGARAPGAQGNVAPRTGGVPPVGATTTNPGSVGISSAPGDSSTTTTGMGTGATSGPNSSLGPPEPGVPNNSTPGTIGTGAAPSGLPGDDPAHPGFPARVGR